MRTAFRRRSREDEEESVFVSMTDMTVSFLFILMIMLAFFASQFNPTDSVTRVEYDQAVAKRDALKAQLVAATSKIDMLTAQISQLEVEIAKLKAELEQERQNPLERYLAQTADTRRRILEQLRDQLRIDFPDLQVQLSEENDALRFQGDGLFASGQSVLRPDKKTVVEDIATRLEQILPCYTLGENAHWSTACNPGAAVIEAVQIEGHTDSTGDNRSNLQLSTQRANETFTTMLDKQPNLDKHLNFRNQPVLSVAGYGEMRPVADNSTSAGRATNRRIDLRIIMYTPAVSTEIDHIRSELGGDARRCWKMSLQDVLSRLQAYQPRALSSLLPLKAAAERIMARWPDAVKEPLDADRERMVREMQRRLDLSDWAGLRTSFVTSAAVALFDPERRVREDLARLRQFYVDEILQNDSSSFRSGMVAVYMGSYVPGAPHTLALGRALTMVADQLGDRWRQLRASVPRLLDGVSAHDQLGQLMLSMPVPWTDLKSIGLRKPHDTGLMTHAHLTFVKALGPTLNAEKPVRKLLDWLRPEGVQFAKSDGGGAAVAALLAPWQKDPPDDLRAELTTRLTSYYGDPRLRSKEAPWSEVPEVALERISRWLTGENIRFFMDIVSAVETSHMWEPRRKFWLQLHKERRINSAWVALSDEGARRARMEAAGRPGLKFGRQTAGGGRVNTCLLILKVGSKIVVEGSHSYKVHIFDEAAPKTPKLYLDRYDCEDIRLIKGSKAKSHLGDWQGWVRENI